MGYCKVHKKNCYNHSSYHVFAIIFERLTKFILATTYPFPFLQKKKGGVRDL